MPVYPGAQRTQFWTGLSGPVCGFGETNPFWPERPGLFARLDETNPNFAEELQSTGFANADFQSILEGRRNGTS